MSFAAISLRGDMMMSEYAPSSFGIARLTLSSIDAELSLSRMIIFEIISASLVVWNIGSFKLKSLSCLRGVDQASVET